MIGKETGKDEDGVSDWKCSWIVVLSDQRTPLRGTYLFGLENRERRSSSDL